MLLCEVPQQLQSWSAQLHEELSDWAASCGQMLREIAHKAKTTAALTETAGQLATLLTGHTQTCNALIRQLQLSHQTWGESWQQQPQVNGELLTGLKELVQQVE